MKDFIDKTKETFKTSKWLAISDGLILAVILVIAGIFYFQFSTINLLKKEVFSSTELLSNRIENLEIALNTSTLTSQELAQRIADQQNQSSQIQENIDDISGTVGTLQKLSQTDKELLQKYSKVYFLSDNYVPMSLQDIDSKYLYDDTKTLQFHTQALVFLNRMLTRASRANVDLKIVSAYRSFGTQSTLKSSYLVSYGSGANQFSADQGYSEHQLGTAIDITIVGLISPLSVGFDGTPGFVWLEDNAYKYGFVLSYPKDNNFYVYEPWHWRFVGVELATKLHDDGIKFFDMEQREIDKYLVNIFD